MEISAPRRDISQFTMQLPASLTSTYTHDVYLTLRQALGQICASVCDLSLRLECHWRLVITLHLDMI